jgi:hypothetical protein
MADLDLAYLDQLEAVELAPLSWGLVDSGFGGDELLDLLDELAERFEDSRSAEDIRGALEARGLITRVRSQAGWVWRTRMAESVRLLVRLRQLFPASSGRSGVPAGGGAEGWRTSPTLVSDYRFIARPRRFPDRPLAPEEYRSIALGGIDDPALARALAALSHPEAGAPTFSAFQARTAATVLAHVDLRQPTATLVAAGTGSGKTKAFYLPAFAKLATLVDGTAWTKLVAVYPRIELLKDQLQKSLDELRNLHHRTGVRLTLGANFGDTPLFGNSEPKYWPTHNGRRVCPMLSCPTCRSDLLWFATGQTGGLECSACDDRVLADEFVLARQQQQKTPPDVLMTTTETLNRHLGSDYGRHVFGAGVRAEHRPRLLLLDEVHTFTGPSGAQAALLLRRWRHAVGQPVHTVGLSATIVDGVPFMADLVGVPPGGVTVVEPHPDEMIEEGKEYLIALRGDPASGTALLSTTIQTTMLLRRLLDRADRPVSQGAFGSKLFAFTDDLDVTNRLLHFLRNAEGQKDRGTPDLRRHPDGSLANLRHPSHPGYEERALNGQAWDLCRELGHDLTPAHNMRVERTSSQDPGLERSADMVVATASLEVGLDDDTVGAVLQHKAPRDAGAFLQRRGRAGRQRSMRPWTAVVLSDYGRDRLAFQAWDMLFDPALRPARLPVANRHVLRMQATFALLDWLAERVRRGGARTGYIWDDLTGPDKGSDRRRQRVRAELVGLMEEDGRRRAFGDHVRAALGVSADEVERLLWEPPRGVMACAVPTLLRRIDAGWRRAGSPGGRDLSGKRPLPDFLPSALFADLLLPEVEIVESEFDDEVYLGVEQALREFSPGRVTHRFAVGHTADRQWVDIGDGLVDIDTYVEGDPLTTITDGDGVQRTVIRPWRLRPTKPRPAVRDASNTRPVWVSTFEGEGQAIGQPAPAHAGWADRIEGLEFHVHQHGGRMVVHRAAIGSEGAVKEGKGSRHVEARFVQAGGPAALGFRLDVDAFRVRVSDPGDWESTFLRDPVRGRGLRTEWFRERVRTHPALPGSVSVFQRDWLAELALAALVERAAEHGGDLAAGARALTEADLPKSLGLMLTDVYQAVDPEAVREAADVDAEESLTALHRDLLAIARTPEARTALVDAVNQLVAPSMALVGPWLRDRYLATVAGAIAHAASVLHEQISIEELVVDRTPWRDGTAELMFSERRPGGVGVVETFLGEYEADPRRFWKLVEAAVRPSEDEQVDAALTAIVAAVATPGAPAQHLADLRAAATHAASRTRWRHLAGEFEREGIALTAPVRTAFSARVLRPGATSQTDQVVHDLLEKWTALEGSLDLELDPRLFAHIAAADSALDESLQMGRPVGGLDHRWRFNAIISLLWPRGSALRSRYLQLWQPFHSLPAPERTLLAERLETGPAPVRLAVGEAGLAEVAGQLADQGVVAIADPGGRVDRRAVLAMLTVPVEVGVLELHPRIAGVRRSVDGITVDLELSEVLG